MRITIQICTKDRHTETTLCLQSLRTQTYQDFDVLILDDHSGVQLLSSEFATAVISRLQLENHKVRVLRREHSFGVCSARNYLLEKDTYKNLLSARIDDDVILEPDYLERLVNVIKKGYDIASGVTPPMRTPDVIRENRFIEPIINKIEIDDKGKLITYKDDCGYAYLEEGVYPANEFRSCAMFKKEVFKDISYPTNLSSVGFREEAHVSLLAQKQGFKIGVDVQAKAYHLQCSSGGVRDPDYANKVKIDQESFEKFVKLKIRQGDLK